jgi:replicative superfamily II helicase
MIIFLINIRILNPLSIKISNKEIVGYGKSYFNDIYNNFISEIIEKLGNESKNLVFAPTAPQARKIANFLSNNYNLINKKNVKINWLIDYLKDSVSDKYSLISIINNGFAYHHGKLPHHVRFVIEMAIKEKLINNVVCTTTLMQGVNLPTQNVIIRNPKLFVKRRKDEGQNPILTKYEIANLSGRAGRLLKDFIGRTFILDEDSFKSRNDDEQ